MDLKLSLIKFYTLCFPNKVRAMEIITEIESTKLQTQQEYDLFRVKILCEHMENLEVMGDLKLDEKVI